MNEWTTLGVQIWKILETQRWHGIPNFIELIHSELDVSIWFINGTLQVVRVVNIEFGAEKAAVLLSLDGDEGNVEGLGGGDDGDVGKE